MVVLGGEKTKGEKKKKKREGRGGEWGGERGRFFFRAPEKGDAVLRGERRKKGNIFSPPHKPMQHQQQKLDEKQQTT